MNTILNASFSRHVDSERIGETSCVLFENQIVGNGGHVGGMVDRMQAVCELAASHGMKLLEALNNTRIGTGFQEAKQ
jgi:hypothetical protein